MAASPTKLRLALTISGAVALGAYEGGALAALLAGIGPLAGGDDPVIRIDAIGGASAGSITGLLAARCLTQGIDPVKVMRAAWVERDSIQSLLAGLQDAPLSPEKLHEMALDLLEDVPARQVEWHQDLPVRLSILLACLRGLDYKIQSAVSSTGVDATTFVDETTATVERGWKLTQFTEPAGASLLDTVLASAANALGFPPVVLDRAALASDYAAKGITNFPPSQHLWYTDGGTVDNEPLGHTLDLVADLDGADATDAVRLHVLVHPHPAAGVQGDAWASPANPPTWLATLVRADHLQRTQSLYDDLRRAEKTNSRVRWAETLKVAFGSLDADGQGALARALTPVDDQIRADRVAFGGAADPTDPNETTEEVFARIVDRIANVHGKREVHLEVISPLVLDERDADGNRIPVGRLLAGEILGHFGGFFDQAMRESDFDLGYQSTLDWLTAGGLTLHGLDATKNGEVLAAAAAAHTPEPRWQKEGDTDLADIALHHPFALAGLMAQVARVAGQDAVRRHPQ